MPGRSPLVNSIPAASSARYRASDVDSFASAPFSTRLTVSASDAGPSVTATQAATGGPSSAPSSADTFTISVPAPAPTITAPANGSQPIPPLSGSGINGDTVTVSIDGTVAGTTTVAGGSWSYTPTRP